MERRMPKITIKYDLPEEREEFDAAHKGMDYKIALDDIYDKLFRPRHKHGYPDSRLDKLCNNRNVSKAIDILEQMYRDIVFKE